MAQAYHYVFVNRRPEFVCHKTNYFCSLPYSGCDYNRCLTSKDIWHSDSLRSTHDEQRNQTRRTLPASMFSILEAHKLHKSCKYIDISTGWTWWYRSTITGSRINYQVLIISCKWWLEYRTCNRNPKENKTENLYL